MKISITKTGVMTQQSDNYLCADMVGFHKPGHIYYQWEVN